MIPIDRIAELLLPYTSGELTRAELAAFQTYLTLIQQWNARTNLTALREPEVLVQRQLGESVFAASLVHQEATVLDFGSGAGFPGIPLQIMHAGVRVTLAESQGKKASFLREAVRALALPAKVWAGRVEDMPAGETFDCVVMRAVDRSEAMLPVAVSKVVYGGRLLRFIGQEAAAVDGWRIDQEFGVPLSLGRLQVLKRA